MLGTSSVWLVMSPPRAQIAWSWAAKASYPAPPAPSHEEGPACRLQFKLQQERLRSNPDCAGRDQSVSSKVDLLAGLGRWESRDKGLAVQAASVPAG